MHHIHMSYTQPGPDSHTSESMHFVLLPNRKRQEKVKSHVSVSTFSHMLYLFRAWVPYQSVRDPANLKGCIAQDSGRFSCDIWGDAFVLACLHH